jgi:hypothetical protein
VSSFFLLKALDQISSSCFVSKAARLTIDIRSIVDIAEKSKATDFRTLLLIKGHVIDLRRVF